MGPAVEKRQPPCHENSQGDAGKRCGEAVEVEQNLCLDKGCDHDEVRDLAIELGHSAIFVPAAKKPKPPRMKLDSKLEDGWWSERIAG